MRHLFRIFLFTVWLLSGYSIAVPAADKDFPESPNPPRLVNDFAGFLKGREETQLERKLVAYDDSTSNQIAIVTVGSIGEYEVSDYAVRLYNKWKIGGSRKNNNGVLILLARDERKIWITTGYGLEGALPDGLVGQIIREEMEPSFKEGRFFDGLDKATDAIMKAARGEYKAEPKKQHKKEKGGPFTAGLILFIFILIIIFSRRGGRGGGGGGGGLLNSVGWIAASMLSNRSSGNWGGGSSWGGGGSWGGGSGGGGFGGFGGGQSGGGGAGGSW